MRYRLVACVVAVCFAAAGQTQSMTVEKLIAFVKNQQQFVKEGKGSDRQTADYLAKVKLTEKLDSSVIEDLQGFGVGQLTLRALERLKEQSRGLDAAHIQPVLPDDPIPPPTSIEQGAILDEVRQYVANYDSTLPDFICTEREFRNIAPRPGTHGTHTGSEPSFQQMDTITSKVTYFNHKEEKKAFLQGSKPIITEYASLGGTTSTGDFGERLRTLFEPATEARFEWSHWATLRTRLTMAFDFKVEQSRSKLTISAKDESREARATPAYYGKVFVDAETRAVTRLEIHADDLPPDFPVKRAMELLDYKYTDISGQQFLLPYSGEVHLDGSDVLSKNMLVFQGYRKYSAESAISYDIPADLTAIPADQLKETPAKPPDCKDPKNKDLPVCKAAPPVKKK